MKQREYVEGPEALKNFERFATAVLQSPKANPKAKRIKAASTSRKSKSPDKN